MELTAPTACDRCGAPVVGGAGCPRHPGAGQLRLRRAGDRALAHQLQSLARARRRRFAGLSATLAAALGGVALLLQSTVPWGPGPAPTGWMVAVALAGAVALVTLAIGAREEARFAAPPSGRTRWLRRLGQLALVLGAPYALLGVGELIVLTDIHPLLAVAKAIPFLLGLATLEAAGAPRAPAAPASSLERPQLAR